MNLFTFQSWIGEYQVDKNGILEGVDNIGLVADLCGLHSFIAANEDYDKPLVDTFEPNRLTVELPLERFNEESIDRLEKLVASKSNLIKKAIDAEDLSIERTENTLRFPWFKLTTNSDEVNAYTQFISALCKAAIEQKRVTAKEKDIYNEKFTFRVFLIRLGFVGDEFKVARKILMRNLSGNSAFAKKGGKADVN